MFSSKKMARGMHLDECEIERNPKDPDFAQFKPSFFKRKTLVTIRTSKLALPTKKK